MVRDIKGVVVKGEYLGFYDVLGKDGKKYLYAQVLQNDDSGRCSIVDIRVKTLDVLQNYEERAPIEIKVDIKELATREGKPFIVIDAA